MSKTLVLLSGGMDSTAALYWARRGHEVVGAVSFDYGSKHNHKEISFAQWHCQQLGLRHDIVVLPFVNDLFSSDLLKSGGDISIKGSKQTLTYAFKKFSLIHVFFIECFSDSVKKLSCCSTTSKVTLFKCANAVISCNHGFVCSIFLFV